jgi:hypothetical protein
MNKNVGAIKPAAKWPLAQLPIPLVPDGTPIAKLSGPPVPKSPENVAPDAAATQKPRLLGRHRFGLRRWKVDTAAICVAPEWTRRQFASLQSGQGGNLRRAERAISPLAGAKRGVYCYTRKTSLWTLLVVRKTDALPDRRRQGGRRPGGRRKKGSSRFRRRAGNRHTTADRAESGGTGCRLPGQRPCYSASRTVRRRLIEMRVTCRPTFLVCRATFATA